jgi:ParB family transcriptional regulator, chromosome partitioning protein
MSKATDAQRKALGKGLSALLPQRNPLSQQPHKEEVPEPAPPSHVTSEKLLARLVPIDWIHPNPHQPRQDFDEDRISELAQSIQANGVIQPITVRSDGENKYLIIAGERRWRAAKEAGLAEVPIFIREVEEDKLLELALVENIQREDLNPIEAAQAFEQLTRQYQLTHEQIAERTGKDRSTITNFLRLLRLCAEVRQELINGRIAMGHARALLAIEDATLQCQACDQIISKELSVRETEQLVKRLLSPAPEPAPPKEERRIDANMRAALDQMAMTLGTKVKIVPRSEKSGRIEIEYYSTEDLQRIYEAIVPEH